jgi:hypothetical protein
MNEQDKKKLENRYPELRAIDLAREQGRKEVNYEYKGLNRWNELSLRQQMQVIELVNHLASNPDHTVCVVSELDGKGQDVLKEEGR